MAGTYVYRRERDSSRTLNNRLGNERGIPAVASRVPLTSEIYNLIFGGNPLVCDIGCLLRRLEGRYSERRNILEVAEEILFLRKISCNERLFCFTSIPLDVIRGW